MISSITSQLSDVKKLLKNEHTVNQGNQIIVQLIINIINSGHISAEILAQLVMHCQQFPKQSEIVLNSVGKLLNECRKGQDINKNETNSSIHLHDIIRTSFTIMIQFHLTRDIAISLKNTIVVDKVWTALIRLNLPSDIQRQILASLECNILPFLPNPILFTDFIHTQIGSQNAMNALLALGGMAYLMLNCGADYPPFYIRLYSLFADQHTSQSYHTRLLQYTDQYLSSPMLPRSIAASFAKKAAQNALKNGYCWACTGYLALIHNILVRHSQLRYMIGIENSDKQQNANPIQISSLDEQKGGKTKNIEIQDGQSSFIMRTDAYRSDHDKFNPNETNPQNTGAENSFLWEIATLTNHYNTQIAKMAHSFVNFETDLSHWDITKFTNQSSKQLFLSALETPMLTGKAARRTRRLGIENNIVGSEAVVEHLPSTGIFERADGLNQFIPSFANFDQKIELEMNMNIQNALDRQSNSIDNKSENNSTFNHGIRKRRRLDNEIDESGNSLKMDKIKTNFFPISFHSPFSSFQFTEEAE